MALLSKTKTTTEMTLSSEERAKYNALNEKAKSFHIKFKKKNRSKLSQHYLLLSQKLTSLRAACSGGSYPIKEDALIQDEGKDEHETKIKAKHSDEDAGRDSKSKIRTRPSDFRFTSKFKVWQNQLT